MLSLNVGCGKDIRQGFINLDWYYRPGVDVVCNIDKNGFPFKNDSFEYIYCSHVLEHLQDVIKTMGELHRISKNGATIVIRVPHFSIYNALAEITHKHSFCYLSFDQFAKDDFYEENYGPAKFKIIEKKINFSISKKLKYLNFIFNPLINKVLLYKFDFYERFFCYLLPSEELYVKLRAVKVDGYQR